MAEKAGECKKELANSMIVPYEYVECMRERLGLSLG